MTLFNQKNSDDWWVKTNIFHQSQKLFTFYFLTICTDFVLAYKYKQ